MDPLRLPVTMGWQDWVGLFSYVYAPYGAATFAWFVSTGGRRGWTVWAENIAGGTHSGGLQALKLRAERALSTTEPRDLDALAEWLVERPRTQRNANLIGLVVYTATLGALVAIYPALCVTDVNVPVHADWRLWLCGAVVALLAVSAVPLAIILNLLHIHGSPATVAERIARIASGAPTPASASSPTASPALQRGFVELPLSRHYSPEPPTNPSMHVSTLPPPSVPDGSLSRTSELPSSGRRLPSRPPPHGERRHPSQKQRYDGSRARISLHADKGGDIEAQLLDFTANHHGMGICCRAQLTVDSIVCVPVDDPYPKPYRIKYKSVQKSDAGDEDRYGLEAVC